MKVQVTGSAAAPDGRVRIIRPDRTMPLPGVRAIVMEVRGPARSQIPALEARNDVGNNRVRKLGASCSTVPGTDRSPAKPGNPPSRFPAAFTPAIHGFCEHLELSGRVLACYATDAVPSFGSISMSCDTASISARWVKACGKFPRCSPAVVSISSA